MRAVFIIPPKVHLLDITGPAHLFYEAADYGADVTLVFAAIFRDTSEMVSSSMLSFNQLRPFDQLELEAGDLVFIPGLEASLLFDTDFIKQAQPFMQWLRLQHAKGIILCSVCTGAFLLAEAGLLDNRCCTTHWKYAERFKERYPGIRLLDNRLFVKDGTIYSSAGVSSGIDLSLFLIEEVWGAYFASQIAKEVVIYFRRTADDPQLSIFTQYRNHLDNRVHQVQDLLSHGLSHKFSLIELSEKVNMSERNLTRLFKNTTGITIGAYLSKLRAAHAQKMLASGHTLQAAALHCGLKSINQLKGLLSSTT